MTVERVIPASPEAIFALVSDPEGHARIDGSGTVRRSREGSRRLTKGDTFGMDMKLGVPYRMRNTVVEYEENRRIAWRQELGRHVWRYELEPVDGATLVRESFDWRSSRAPWLLELIKAPEKNREGMTKTLARIEELLGSGA